MLFGNKGHRQTWWGNRTPHGHKPHKVLCGRGLGEEPGTHKAKVKAWLGGKVGGGVGGGCTGTCMHGQRVGGAVQGGQCVMGHTCHGKLTQAEGQYSLSGKMCPKHGKKPKGTITRKIRYKSLRSCLAIRAKCVGNPTTTQRVKAQVRCSNTRGQCPTCPTFPTCPCSRDYHCQLGL